MTAGRTACIREYVLSLKAQSHTAFDCVIGTTQAASAVGGELFADHPGALLSPRRSSWRRPGELVARLGLRALGLSFPGAPYDAVGQARHRVRKLRRWARRLL